MSEIKWMFLDVGSTLVDESDVYESRCNYVIRAKGLEHDEFIEKVHQAAKVSPKPIKQAAQTYGVTLPEWDSSLEKLYLGTEDVLKALSGKYKLGIIANQLAGTLEKDVELVQTGKIKAAHWHFYRSPTTGKIGASRPLLKLLDDCNIKVTIHY